MRCPDCNKFVPFDTDEDPEVGDPEFNDGEVSCDVTINNNCGECGTCLTTYSFNLSEDATEALAAHVCTATEQVEEGEEPAQEWTVETGEVERTSRTEGKGRGLKTFYGVKVQVPITCDACGLVAHTVELSDDIQSSGMDEA